jgi:hypothetical protein
LAKHQKKDHRRSGKKRPPMEDAASQPQKGERQVKRGRRPQKDDAAGGAPKSDRPFKRGGSGGGSGGGFRRQEPRDPHAVTEEISEKTIPILQKAREETDKMLAHWIKQAEKIRNTPRTASELDVRVLDPWQQQAFEALMNGDSVIVDAPTTAGKTRVIEAFFRENLENPNFRACYTTPVKSLSNDKLREFRDMFGRDRVGIATGDIKENLDAPIVVATLESYRNSLLGVEPDLGRSIAIFDEYHYLQDDGRGSAWEESLILTPSSCQLLLLSASVDNPEQFCSWLQSLGEGRKCVMVRTEKRPVPLENFVWIHNGWYHKDTVPEGFFKNPDKQKMLIPVRQEELAGRLTQLIEMQLTPSIVYVGRRLACETMAGFIAKRLPPLEDAAAEAISAALQVAQKEFQGLTFLGQKLRQMIQGYGVAYHHSGLAAPARMAVEYLVKNGLLRFCTATMGLSLGINFSVRSTVISDYQRPGEAGFTNYAPSEVLQMLGRAGRRGRDAVGFSMWPSPEAFIKFGAARRENVNSRLKNDPTTFLGLVGRGYSLRGLEHFYGKSFRRFQDKNVDLSLVTRSRLGKKLNADDMPCESPAAHFARFWTEDKDSACYTCKYRKNACHPYLEAKTAGNLTALHLHLHATGALNMNESLSSFGSIARYFPQAGGMVIAKLIADGTFNQDNVHHLAEVAGAFTLARFKEPGFDGRYRLPIDAHKLEEMLELMYPQTLFDEIYDPPFGKRSYPVIKEFNPAAGYLVKEWIQGKPWKELVEQATSESYGIGDLMSLFYRVATYLQSVNQADIPQMKQMARTLRDVILRDPLSLALTT